jgi:hypothetical protein
MSLRRRLFSCSELLDLAGAQRLQRQLAAGVFAGDLGLVQGGEVFAAARTARTGCSASHCTGYSAVASAARTGWVMRKRVSATIRNSDKRAEKHQLGQRRRPLLEKGRRGSVEGS